MENPIKMDDFGGTTIFGNIQRDLDIIKLILLLCAWDDPPSNGGFAADGTNWMSYRSFHTRGPNSLGVPLILVYLQSTVAKELSI